MSIFNTFIPIFPKYEAKGFYVDHSKTYCYNVKVLKHPSTEKAILCKIDEEAIKTSKEFLTTYSLDDNPK
ncbi:spermidine synthase [Clostridium botulinum]|uniref:spermine/spermidine synthase domain-containing protein n=1 Tax=Clostridium botulinum TaxID=1491 RepID=UPI000172553C|nr:spermidine synthase [Clostridium botulinum]EDT81852.1 spermidine synthase [Clostridium botulinum NCTC 2916]KEI82167.1 spermidine synthase [Clostridium botulinum B2 331]KEI88348.1 spermidine synthase [Clostridium botulinum B2 267]AUN01008.1 spermidine synthase [Clostridium botulinum]AUN19656.1 spermidine synthase [Clostridium botulinum]